MMGGANVRLKDKSLVWPCQTLIDVRDTRILYR